MSIRRRWSATCDAPGCTKTEFLEGDQYDGKWVLGESLNDNGWQASPGADATFCPEHATDNPPTEKGTK